MAIKISKMIGRYFFPVTACLLTGSVVLFSLSCSVQEKRIANAWSTADVELIAAFSLSQLQPLMKDPTNRYADNEMAAKLGHKLFFDSRLSLNGEVACSSCHQSDKNFTDGEILAVGVGITGKNAPTIVGTAYNDWYFWDGRKDSQWAQALGPLESLVEHGATRVFYAKIIDQFYKKEYQHLFGRLESLADDQRFPPSAGPNGTAAAQTRWQQMQAKDRDTITRVFVNVGKAIAAYERKILPGRSRFDDYVDTLKVNRDAASQILSLEEAQGLKLFMGRANCIQCHAGPLFTNQGFHNIGLQPLDPKQAELGRDESVHQVLGDEFNCLSKYSDAKAEACVELNHVKRKGIELLGAFKTPTLRNISKTAPYMHRGQFPTLSEVLEHYNVGQPPFYNPEQHYERPHSDLLPMAFSPEELGQVQAFLHALDSDIAADAFWLQSPLP